MSPISSHGILKSLEIHTEQKTLEEETEPKAKNEKALPYLQCWQEYTIKGSIWWHFLQTISHDPMMPALITLQTGKCL